jgi:hypothetical protein
MISRRNTLLLLLLSFLSVTAYLLASHFVLRVGFPLDDSWIYQTYARNLVDYGEWAFQPGRISGGSTGPLWTMLVSVGYFLRLGPYIWTFFLGGILLWFMGLFGVYAAKVISPEIGARSLWVGILLIFEWHLVWAAGSGMETLGYALLATWILVQLIKAASVGRHWLVIGLLIGLCVWLRPDGLTLMGPAVLVLLLADFTWKEKIRLGGFLLLGFCILFGLYLLFNQVVAGGWWPTTFYAKQAEYAELKQISFGLRLLQISALPLVGAGVILLPGFGATFVDALRRGKWRLVAVALWIPGYFGLYAWRLPVTYQHGRYLIPVMPIFFILGAIGLFRWVRQDPRGLLGSQISKVWPLTGAAVLVLFWLIGARTYAWDVGVIESEMVQAARWVAVNTPQDSLIAAHDIGALGYFCQRDLLDLAGLISPDVIPIIRDEQALGVYLDSQGADYLVTFPDWYKILAARAVPVFQTGGIFSPTFGKVNVVVYRWIVTGY